MRLALLLSLLAAPALAQTSGDRAPTPEETASIEAALTAAGFTAWEEVELDDGVWEVDDAVAADGRRYDVTLDQAFAIAAQDPD